MAAKQFCTSTFLMLTVATCLIISEAIVTDGSRKCYWCGPLAEQVHRSQRAPPCDEISNPTTECEPGLNYCAIVATSPPYIESRLCVKLYQDECYPLYCNSTKIWKMTCPCQGDLCNGPNTERETDSFAVLSKLITKTKNARIYKRTQQTSPVKFITNESEKTQIITNISAFDKNRDISHDKNSDHVTNIAISEETLIVENLIDANNIESTEFTKTEDIPSSHNTAVPSENIPQITNVFQENDELQSITTDIIVTLVDTEMVTPTAPSEVIQINFNEMNASETKPRETIEIKPNEPTLGQIKPSETLPTAEALQQNGSPNVETEKNTPPTTTLNTETTDITTIFHEEPTTEHSKPKKNGAIKAYSTILLVAINFFTIHVVL